MKKIGYILIGVLIGGVLLNGNAIQAAVETVAAQRSTMLFFLNGSPVEVEAYVINGNNYLKLRDIAALVDFGVSYSEASRAVMIDTMVGYTPEGQTQAQPTQPVQPQEATHVSYSDDANPAAFTATYTRTIYDALRQAIVTGQDSAPFALTSEEMQNACRAADAAVHVWPAYNLESMGNGMAKYIVHYSSSYQAAADYCTPFINGLAGKTDREKVCEMAFFVCDRLTYDRDSTSSPRTALVDSNVHKGNCMSFAHNFKFLCDMAGIPCVFVHSDIHQWNEVYLEGRWWSIDVTGVDVGYDPAVRETRYVLHDQSYMQGYDYIQSDPALTRFAKELLVPGSTK